MHTQFPIALHSLRQRLAQKEALERKSVLGVYRALRRACRSRVLLATLPNQLELLVSAARAHSYDSVILGLKLAQEYTLTEALKRGPEERALRLLMKEAFHLLRRQLRMALGRRPPEPDPSIEWGKACERPFLWQVITDGSWKDGNARQGFVLFDPDRELRAVARLVSPVQGVVASEMLAACQALDTALAFGASHVSLQTDCIAVFRAMQGRLAPRHRHGQAALLDRVALFKFVKVTLVPRTETRLADALAAGTAMHRKSVD